jgi:hypothetical protein
VFSRLTKYPLLFENLAKYTEEDTEELISVLRAVERSKEILNHVNQAVREAEDIQRLSDIQKRLDKSGFEKVEHPMASEFKVCEKLCICSHLGIMTDGEFRSEVSICGFRPHDSTNKTIFLPSFHCNTSKSTDLVPLTEK